MFVTTNINIVLEIYELCAVFALSELLDQKINFIRLTSLESVRFRILDLLKLKFKFKIKD